MAEVTTFVPYSLTKSCAFWDVEDFPVPVGGDLSSFSCNLETAMYDGVFREAPSIKAYSAVQTEEVNDRYRSVNIPIEYQENDKRKRLCKMLLDIDDWARSQPTSKDEMGVHTKVLIIEKDLPDKESLFVPIMKELNAMHYDISLVVPDEQPPLSKEVLSIPPIFVWTWGSLFRGGRFIQDEAYYGEGSDDDE